jgi:GGDEF domain-containing protein
VDSLTGRSRDPDHPRTSSLRAREPCNALELELELELGTPERWVLAKVRRRGVAGFVIQMTALAVVASVVLTTAMMVAFYPVEASYLEPAIFLGALVPALVAPPLLVFCVRLAARLDAASHLLWQAARTDPLTGIPNRRAYFEALDDAAAAPPQAYDVALLDIDSFKAVNDHHGHEAGDLALEEVAEWLTELVGPDGLVARVGGDEFAVLAPADPSRSRPTRRDFTGRGPRFSVSIGWKLCDAGGVPEQCLHDADLALYAAKADNASTTPSI